ncbi:RNA chaperone Hfq [Bacillus paramycoides]
MPSLVRSQFISHLLTGLRPFTFLEEGVFLAKMINKFTILMMVHGKQQLVYKQVISTIAT